MTLKTVAKRVIGQEIEATPPDEQTDQLEAKRAAAALRLKALLDGAATESGNRVRDLHEWQGVRHVLTSVRLKARLAGGMPEARARREVDTELDDLEDEIGRLVAEARGLEQQQAAERAREMAQTFTRAKAEMTRIYEELAGSPEMRALFARLPASHAQTLEIRTLVMRTCGNNPARIPDIGVYPRRWDMAELIGRAAGLYEAQHHGKERI